MLSVISLSLLKKRFAALHMKRLCTTFLKQVEQQIVKYVSLMFSKIIY